jgi:hypothetical protein
MIARVVLLLLLVVLSIPAPIGAETTVYFAGRAVSVPPPLVLFLCGLALLSVGPRLRKWVRLWKAESPELEFPDRVPRASAK